MNHERATEFGYLSPLTFKRRADVLKDPPSRHGRPPGKCASGSPLNERGSGNKIGGPPRNNFFEQQNTSTSKGRISHSKQASGLRERPTLSRPNTRSHSNLSDNNRKAEAARADGGLRKVQSFKAGGNALWGGAHVKVDRKQLTKIKAKLRTKLDIVEHQLEEVRATEQAEKRQRLTSVKQRKLFAKLETLKHKDGDAKARWKTDCGGKTTKTASKKPVAPKSGLLRGSHENDSASSQQNLLKEKIRAACTNKKSGKTLATDGSGATGTPVQTKALRSTKKRTGEKAHAEEQFRSTNPTSLLSMADLPQYKVDPSPSDKLSSKANTSTRIFVQCEQEAAAKAETKPRGSAKRQKIINRSSRELEQIKLTPLLIPPSVARICDNAPSSKRKHRSSVKKRAGEAVADEQPVDVALLLQNRKLLTVQRFQYKLKGVKSNAELRKLNTWYQTEMAFIGTIEASLKPKEAPQPVAAKEEPAQLSSNHSWLNSKRSVIGIDLSFEREGALKRKNSALISDPDVISLKRECIAPIAKTIAAIKESDLSISYIAEAGVAPALPKPQPVDTQRYLRELDELCDHLLHRLVTKFCRAPVKRQAHVRDIFGKRSKGLTPLLASAAKRQQQPPAVRLSTSVSALEAEISGYFDTLLRHYRAEILRPLNISYGPDCASLMGKLSGNRQVDLSLYHEYTTKPIVPACLWARLRPAAPASPAKQAYDSLIVDCMNEALCTWRPNVFRYPQLPWQVRPGFAYKNRIADRDLDGVIAITKNKIKEWSMLLCGYFMGKHRESGDLLATNMSESFVDVVREDRVVKLLNWEIIDAEEKWVSYELEATQVSALVEQQVWDCLVDELAREMAGAQ